MERTVVSCVIGVVWCARVRGAAPNAGKGLRSRRARGGDDLRICVDPLTRREETTRRAVVRWGGMAEQAEFSTSEKRHVARYQRILLNIVDSINKS